MRALIDVTISMAGAFSCPANCIARAGSCYPELPAFLVAKRAYDPTELFSSTFYRAIKALSGTT